MQVPCTEWLAILACAQVERILSPAGMRAQQPGELRVSTKFSKSGMALERDVRIKHLYRSFVSHGAARFWKIFWSGNAFEVKEQFLMLLRRNVLSVCRNCAASAQERALSFGNLNCGIFLRALWPSGFVLKAREHGKVDRFPEARPLVCGKYRLNLCGLISSYAEAGPTASSIPKWKLPA